MNRKEDNGHVHLLRLGRLGVACGAALLAAACGGGGGGGGGGGDLGVYTGTTTAVPITAATGTATATTALNEANLNTPVLAILTKPGGGAVTLGDLLRRMSRHGHRAGSVGAGKADARLATKQTFTCDATGTYTEEDGTNASGVGPFKTTFTDCDFGDGVVINGTDTDNVALASVTGAGEMYRGHEAIQTTMQFAGDDYKFRGEIDYDEDGVALKDRHTGTLELWNQTAADGFRLQNVDLTETFADQAAWNDFCVNTSDWTGRVFDGATGFVDAATTTPLAWTTDDCDNPGPSSGGPIVLSGDADGEVVVTPLSDTQASVATDEDGDGTPEGTSTEVWSALGYT